MKWTIVGLFLVGIVAAGAAAMLALAINARGGSFTAVDPGLEEIDILVATRDLPANAIIEADAVGRSKVQRKNAPEKYLANETQVIGQMLIADVIKGQAFTGKQFPEAGSDVAIIRALKPGMRAMSILLSSEQGIENILYPGCLVDVVATFRLPPPDGQGFGEIVSATVLRQVSVLAVGQRTVVSEKTEKEGGTSAADTKRGRMITLQVDPQQGEMLQLAVTQGTVSVSLRNPLDKTEDKVGDGTRLGDLSKDLADKIRRLQEGSNRKGETLVPPMVAMTPAGAGNGTASQPVIVETKADEPDDEPMWPIDVLRGGKIVDTMRFPMSKVDGKK